MGGGIGGESGGGRVRGMGGERGGGMGGGRAFQYFFLDIELLIEINARSDHRRRLCTEVRG